MKCPKCGFTSFDYLDSCKKCGNELQAFKNKFGLRSVLFPGFGAPAETSTADASEPADTPVVPLTEGIALGFDFMSSGETEEDHEEETQASSDLDNFDREAETAPGSFDQEPGSGADELFLQEEEPLLEEEISDLDLEDDPALGEIDFDEDEERQGFTYEGDREEPDDPFEFRESATQPGLPASGGSSDELLADQGSLWPRDDTQPSLDDSELTPPVAEPPQPPLIEAPQKDPAALFFEPEADFSFGDEGQVAAHPELAAPPEEESPSPEIEEIYLAPLPTRLAATLVDLVMLGVVFLAFLAIGELMVGDPASGRLFPEPRILLELAVPYFLVLFTLSFGYFTLFHFLTGQTPGKMIFRLRVESLEGQPLQFSQAFLRSVGGLFSLLVGGLGFLVILFNATGRGWNDQYAGTRLVAVYPAGPESDPA